MMKSISEILKEALELISKTHGVEIDSLDVNYIDLNLSDAKRRIVDINVKSRCVPRHEY